MFLSRGPGGSRQYPPLVLENRCIQIYTISGPAYADVVVPPGGFGNICTGYSYIRTNPNVYWQTCAWADNNEVYFTVHFGNASGSTFYVDYVDLGFYRSGVFYLCPGPPFPYYNWAIPAHSINRTPTSVCAFPRVRAAYQARAVVQDGSYSRIMMTDSLQVQ